MQLQGQIEAFQAAGFGVVALTYDAPELQQAFIARSGFSAPLLSDIDAASVTALGILNADYAPGDRNHGLPYPGVFVIGPDGTVAGKLFIDGYETRVDAAAVLAFARAAVQQQ